MKLIATQFTEPHRKARAILRVGGGLSGIGALIVSVACGASKPQVPTHPTVRVSLEKTAGETGSGWVAATLTSTQRATLSTRMAGHVKKVYVHEGQHVAAGALLVSLADEDLQGGWMAAQAGVAAAEAQYRRIENLMKAGASMAAEQDQARTGLAQAQASLAQAQGALAHTQIRAPFSGVIQARRVSEGDFAGPGMPLLELEGQGAQELVGSLSAAEAAGLQVGTRMSFEAEGVRGEAQVTALSTGGDPISHRGSLRAKVLRSDTPLRSGSFARLRLPGRPASGSADAPLSVGRSALVFRGELTGVFVARDGRAELRWLSLGEPSGDRYPVRAGLVKGEAVIDAPGGLRDGQPIEIAVARP